MSVYEIGFMNEKLASNAYPGRGIVLGVPPDGYHLGISEQGGELGSCTAHSPI